jgi:ubiquinone biosynthesis protein Coq4
MNTNIRFRTHLAQFFLELNIFQTKAVEKIEADILYSVTFGFKNRALFEITWKNTVEPDRLQMTIWITWDILGYKHTHSM